MQDKSTMEEQYGGSEMLSILIPPTDSLQLLYGAVESFGFTVVLSSSERIENTSGMLGKHIEYLVNLGYMCPCGFDEPHGVECEGLLSVCHTDNIPEVLLDSPCTRHLVISLADGIELHLLHVGEAGRVLEKEILGFLQFGLCLYLTNPCLVYRLVQVLDEMIWVVTNLGVWKQQFGYIDEGLPHIHGYRLYCGSLDGSQVLLYQLLGILLGTALRDVNHIACVTIAEDSNEVSLASRLFVDAQMVVYLDLTPDAQAKFHAAFHDMTHLVRSEAQKAGCSDLALRLEQSLYRFFFEQFGHALPSIRPGDLHAGILPVRQLAAGYACLDVRLVLPHVQVSPDTLWSKIVYGEVFAGYHDIRLAVLHLYIYALVRIVRMDILDFPVAPAWKQKGCKYLGFSVNLGGDSSPISAHRKSS